MPSITIPSANLQVEGPTVEVQFLIPKQIEEQYRKENKTIPAPISVKALIDTGATNCVVRQDVPIALGLQPIDILAFGIMIYTGNANQFTLSLL